MAGGGRKQQAGLALWLPEQLDEDERTGGLPCEEEQARCLPAAATATPSVSVHRDRLALVLLLLLGGWQHVGEPRTQLCDRR
jgi:hypothetical protein